MAALPSSLFLTVAEGSTYHASVQLIYKLPGKYRLVRRTHHTHIIEGTHLSYRDLISPSHGTSEVILRPSTDADHEYEMELVQTTTINLRTRYGQAATKIEKRAFRIRNGRWSMWAVHTEEGFDVVGRKAADLTLVEVASPKQVGATAADVVQKAALRGGPWQDGRGTNAMAMCVWVGRQLCWQLSHQVDRKVSGASEICGDEFWPAVEDGVEGRA